jgi:hypothetical protein
MKKQTTTHYNYINAAHNQFKDGGKTPAVKKNPRYIYTEEDLGEGILDVGVSAYYAPSQLKGMAAQSWVRH